MSVRCKVTNSVKLTVEKRKIKSEKLEKICLQTHNNSQAIKSIHYEHKYDDSCEAHPNKNIVRGIRTHSPCKRKILFDIRKDNQDK